MDTFRDWLLTVWSILVPLLYGITIAELVILGVVLYIVGRNRRCEVCCRPWAIYYRNRCRRCRLRKVGRA